MRTAPPTLPLALLALCLSAPTFGCDDTAPEPDQDAALSPDTPTPETTDATPPAPPATLALPPLPLWDHDGLTVDLPAIAAAAGAWCAQDHADTDPAAFFYGALPLGSVDQLCDAAGDPDRVRALLGDLYLSGYFGGVWFRDHAELMGVPTHGDPDAANPGMTQEDFAQIADNAATLRTLAADGDPAQVFAHNYQSVAPDPDGPSLDTMMDNLLIVYAYNFGYVKAIQATPPAGQSDDDLQCAAFLQCHSASTTLQALDRFLPALDRLAAPPDDRWREMSDAVAEAQQWVDVGQSLWSGGEIEPAIYDTLVRLNAGYLFVAGAATLGSMTGYADQDEQAGRCALLLEAAADTWNRAYFAGLRSNLEPGTAPALTCPDP